MNFISTNKSPAAIGPYSQAVKCNGMLMTSGQIALDPETMEMVGDNILDQTHRVLKNLHEVLLAASCKKSDVIKTTIFLKDMSDFSIVNKIYEQFFGDHKPSRSTVEVSALPKGALIEIDLIAKTN